MVSDRDLHPHLFIRRSYGNGTMHPAVELPVCEGSGRNTGKTSSWQSCGRRVYNVAGEDTRPLKEYIEELFKICGEKGSYEFGYRPPNAEGCVSLMPELTKLKNAIGFHQQVSFKEGILETIKGEQVK